MNPQARRPAGSLLCCLPAGEGGLRRDFPEARTFFDRERASGFFRPRLPPAAGNELGGSSCGRAIASIVFLIVFDFFRSRRFERRAPGDATTAPNTFIVFRVRRHQPTRRHRVARPPSKKFACDEYRAG